MDIDFAPSPHTEAAAAIRAKVILSQKVFAQLLPELRNRAFTVTGIEAANTLQTVREQIAGLAEGETWDHAKQGIVDSLEPTLGDGAEKRATLLLRTHGFQAFNASTWRLAHEDDETTHLQYLATEDDRVRDSHLALNGVILPKNDPFWDQHYPPSEWNCRCRVRTMSADQVSDERHEDLKRPPEGKLVLEGAVKRKLEEGTLVRPQWPTGISVLPDERPGAFRFHPDNLIISLGDLKMRYDAETWDAFVDNAKNTLIRPGLTLWNYLSSKPSGLTPEEIARIDRQTIRQTEGITDIPEPRPRVIELPSSGPGIRRADASEAKLRIASGVTAKSPRGDNVLIGPIFRGHAQRIEQSNPNDIRARFLPAAIRTIEDPAEIWERDNRRYYLARFVKDGQKGFLVVTARKGETRDEVITFMPKSDRDLEAIREGRLIYRKQKTVS